MSKCKNCVNLRNNWCEKVSDSPYENMERECVHFRHMTNADRIRAMSDEELAGFLHQVGYDHRWGLKEYVLEWLQKPAEEDGHDERKENENV